MSSSPSKGLGFPSAEEEGATFLHCCASVTILRGMEDVKVKNYHPPLTAPVTEIHEKPLNHALARHSSRNANPCREGPTPS